MTSTHSTHQGTNELFNKSRAVIYDRFHYVTTGFFDQYGDPRIDDYPMMRTPWIFVSILIFYYWFVRHGGPQMMRNRKPYQITNLVRAYNLYLIGWGAFGFYSALPYIDYGLALVGCRPVNPNQRDHKTLTQIYFGWVFVMSRLVELLDTVFFVLRKKSNQITKFHVFHHIISPLVCWTFLKFVPGGNSGIFPFLNTQVHLVMYTYYFLATFPAMKPYLGWKKYLTQMQMIQFGLVILNCMHPLFIPGCEFPRAMLIIIILLAALFVYLFYDFYSSAYKKKDSNNSLQTEQQQQQLEATRKDQ